MATYKRQLRDKDGNTIYPDVGLELDDVIYGSNPEQVETPSPWIETGDIKDNQITSAKIADGAVTNAKIDWSTLNYMPGDTVSINDDNFNLSGRLWVSGSNKFVLCSLPLDKKIDSSVTSITFTQTNYLNIYGGSSLIFSQNTSSSIVWTVTKSATVLNTLLFKIQLPSGTSITTNTCCSLDFKGTITFA